MKITLSGIKADIGSIGGHLRPSNELLEKVRSFIENEDRGLVFDFRVTFCGDDIAILMTHKQGKGNQDIHQLAWNAFVAGTGVAKRQGLYGAGQDLLKDAFSGNVKGLGPAVAEMEIEERPNECFIFFTADKTDPGAYNLPLYLGFADPMYCSGLLLSPKISQGFVFKIIDVEYTECAKCRNFHLKGARCEGVDKNPRGDRAIKLVTPEDLYKLAALLRDQERFVIEAIYSRASGEQGVAVSTTRLHNIAGKYTGKDDPICLVRTQGNFPATGEILSPYAIGHFVAGFMRGSHNGPLMPVLQNTPVSFFDGPPQVSGCAYSIKDGKFTEGVDVFSHPFWDEIRRRISKKAIEIRRQGFFGPAMLPYSELEYGGIVEILKELEGRFEVVSS